MGRAGWAGYPGGRRVHGRQPGDPVLRPAAGQAVRARYGPGPGTAPGPGRGSVLPDRWHQDQPAVPRRPAGQRRVQQRRLRHVGGQPAASLSRGQDNGDQAVRWRPGEGEERPVAEVRAEMVANVWKVVAAEGEQVSDGTTLVILESMKMEIPVLAEQPGTITKLAVAEGDVVQEGDLIAIIQ